MIMVPSVAMKAGSLVTDTSKPLTRPTRQHAASVTPLATHGSIPPLVIRVAEIMLDIPATEPIERSMPPVIMTKDWPMPMIMIGTTWRSRLVVFSPEKKDGLMMPKTRIITHNAAVTEMTCPMPRMARISL